MITAVSTFNNIVNFNWVRLTRVHRIFVNELFKKSFNTIFIKNIKVVKEIICLFLFSKKKFLKIFHVKLTNSFFQYYKLSNVKVIINFTQKNQIVIYYVI